MLFLYSLIIISSFLLPFLFKSNLIKIMIFIYAYPMIHMAYLLLGGEPVRILDQVGFSYYQEYIAKAFYVYYFSFLIFVMVLTPIRTRSFRLCSPIVLEKKTVWILLALLIVSSIVCYPWTFGLTDRREMLLPGNGWVSIFIGTYIVLAISNNANDKFLKTILFLFPLYFILSGERVNNILFVFLLMLISNGSEIYLNKKLMAKIAPAVFCFFILAYVAGNLRSELSFLDVDFFYLFNYITAMEALHVYYSSLWYVDFNGNTPEPIINVIASFLPFNSYGGAGSKYFFENIIASEIYTVGGGIFISEGYLVMGWVGAALWSLILGLVVKRAFMSDAELVRVLFLVMFCLSFRVFWYGWQYIITPFYITSIYFIFFRGFKRNV